MAAAIATIRIMIEWTPATRDMRIDAPGLGMLDVQMTLVEALALMTRQQATAALEAANQPKLQLPGTDDAAFVESAAGLVEAFGKKQPAAS